MKTNLSGIFAPICTPFKNGSVAMDQLANNMKQYRMSRLSGYFVLGSNGESSLLTDQEKLRVVEVVLDQKADGQVVMVGAGHESTDQTISFGKNVVSMGVDYVSILTPSYYKKRYTTEAMVRYYSDVADELTAPVIVYNAPGFTGVTLSPEVIATISAHPNIAGMKDTSKGNMSKYISAAEKRFSLLSGSISTLFESMMLGANGGVVSLANAFADPCIDLYEACETADIQTARRLHYLLNNLSSGISGRFGVAGVKYAMELAGLYGGDPRRPILPLTDVERYSIKTLIDRSGILSISN